MSRSAPRDGCLSSVDAVDAGCAPRGVEGVDGVDDIDGVDGVGSSTAPKSASVRRRRLALAPLVVKPLDHLDCPLARRCGWVCGEADLLEQDGDGCVVGMDVGGLGLKAGHVGGLGL